MTISADAEDGEDDRAFADLIEAHWRAGALGMLSHGEDAWTCPLRTAIAAVVPDQRFNLIDMLDAVEEAGAAWAMKRFEQAASDFMAKRAVETTAPKPVPAVKSRRRKVVT